MASSTGRAPQRGELEDKNVESLQQEKAELETRPAFPPT